MESASATRARRFRRHGLVAVIAGLAALGLAGCEEPEVPVHQRVVGGDPELGLALIARYGCGSCHRVPGLRTGRGTVGPPLDGFGRRSFIAGQVPNRPDMLTLWIRDPPAIDAMTAMPNLGVGIDEATHIAAYLYSLR